jgi:hypothetical protein
MSDRVAVCIKIGGKIRNTGDAEALRDAILLDNVQVSWGDCYIDYLPTEDLSVLCNASGQLWLCDDQSSTGEFPTIQRVCRQIGLSYWLHCDGGDGYNSGIEFWKPGMKVPVNLPGSVEHEDDAMVTVSQVRRIRALISSGRQDRALRMLDRLCPALPKIPKLQIGG